MNVNLPAPIGEIFAYRAQRNSDIRFLRIGRKCTRERILCFGCFVFAANPINTYKPIKLSTAEAIAAALYIADLKTQATDIMSVFKWGPSFITLNMEWLDAYAECRNSTEVVRVQSEIMESQGYTIDSEEKE